VPDPLRVLHAEYVAFKAAHDDTVAEIAARAGLHPKAMLRAIRRLETGEPGALEFATVAGIARAIGCAMVVKKRGSDDK
jgi:DNA-binding phage protein